MRWCCVEERSEVVSWSECEVAALRPFDQTGTILASWCLTDRIGALAVVRCRALENVLYPSWADMQEGFVSSKENGRPADVAPGACRESFQRARLLLTSGSDSSCIEAY